MNAPAGIKTVTTLPPAQRGNQRIDWEAVASMLRAKPGEWGVLTDVSKTMGTQIRRGRVAALRPVEEWEATVRRDPDLPSTRATLYLRYVGA